VVTDLALSMSLDRPGVLQRGSEIPSSREAHWCGVNGAGSLSSRRGILFTLGLILGALALCQVIYRPCVREPLDILDFSEFLLRMRWDANPWNNLSGLARYYAGHGRVNEVPYILIAVTYQWFKVDPLGWQALRAVQMLIVPVGVYMVARRLGATGFGSALGASLFLFGTAAASNWLRQTAEPIGTLFFLCATGLVCGFSQEGASWPRAALLALCVTGMLLSKETFVACIPFLILVAACWESGGHLRSFHIDKPTMQVSAACGFAMVVLAVALAWAYSLRQPEPYAALYGSAPIGGDVWAGRVLPLILPVTVSEGGARSLFLFPANLVFAGLVVTGVLLSTRWPDHHRVQRKLLIAATLPIAGLLVYLPWPRYEPFYSLPFFLGAALWAAILLGRLGQDGRWRAALSVCWLLVLGISAVTAAELAGYTRARREVNQAVALELSTRKQTDTVIVASARLAPQAWQNPGVTLGRYALATRIARSLPVLIDTTCNEAVNQMKRQQASAMYVYVGGCGEMGIPDRRIEKPFSFFDWSLARSRTQAFTVDVFDRHR